MINEMKMNETGNAVNRIVPYLKGLSVGVALVFVAACGGGQTASKVETDSTCLGVVVDEYGTYDDCKL
ncbi:MAG TPA: hypothetical protein QF695_09795 [Arenicellales bacterium]|jgi:hypothetical protein|nr:hypothetical protein [Arenicellales bacterium]HJL52916.1 hypothetical protein [Arenicellales bacterium]|tara:strand:- start:341 stop:544 length:204 start_codon:yes stop_codon:yes gene_type:complete